ncbi:DUF4157 domain-containing protein [Streptomyces sp. NPDC096152]|uniref:eCIS core domain-containing protein n=1 Tax=Streptomyces sp. NPDC096152 TaxID=3366078 RepID=UPI00380D0A49
MDRGAPMFDSAPREARPGAGRPLEASVRREMEERLGADLGAVRVHTGPEAAVAADRLGARAVTVGQDVAFGSGQYRPGEPEGASLVAHELAHTVQQARGGPTVACAAKAGGGGGVAALSDEEYER